MWVSEGCLLSLNEENVLQALQNNVQGRKETEVRVDWEILSNEELCDMCVLPDIFRAMNTRQMDMLVRGRSERGAHDFDKEVLLFTSSKNPKTAPSAKRVITT
jgi:hypothetical protein